MKYFLVVLALFGAFTLITPASVFAVDPCVNATNPELIEACSQALAEPATPTTPATPAVSANSAASAALATAQLSNPLGTDDVRVIIGRIIKAILGVSGGLALVMFIWGGLIWMTSQGEKARIEKGQKTLVWAVIGLAILFVAYAAVNWVILALQQSTC